MDRPGYPRWVAAVLILVLLGILVAQAGARPTGLERATTSHDEPSATGQRVPSMTIDVRQTFHRLPGRPGSVRVVVHWEIPNRTKTLRTRVPENATVTGTEGFRPTGRIEYTWDNETTSATITYRLSVNVTTERTGPVNPGGQYLFVGTGEWALFQRPQVPTVWTWEGQPSLSLNRSVTVAGPGAVGRYLVYLGEQTTHRRRAHNQTFELVVPDRARLAESPDEILSALTDASDRLRVGDRDETVTMIAAPTGDVAWGRLGLQIGDAEAWVRDAERLSTPENAWIHEYVHTRQDFKTTRKTAWTIEGTATYYAAFVSWKQDRIGTRTYLAYLRSFGTAVPQVRSVLSNPRKWYNNGNYLKGLLVTAELDRRIRVDSGDTHSFQSVFAALNAAGRPINQSRLLDEIERVSSESVRQTAVRYTTTTDAPDVWSPSVQRRTFDAKPALFTARFREGPGAFEVAGPYRNTTLSGGKSGRPVVYINETLTVTGNLRNVGGASARVRREFRVNGTTEGAVSAMLSPGESRAATFEHTVTTVGRLTVTFGSDTLVVMVRQPGPASVANSSVNRSQLDDPGVVTVTATVANDGSIPGEKTVTFRKNGSGFAKRTVRVGANDNRTITATVTLNATGTYRLRAGRDDPIIVRVGAAGSGTGPGNDGAGSGRGAGGSGQGSSGGGPVNGLGSGPGLVGVTVALVIGLWLLTRRVG